MKPLRVIKSYKITYLENGFVQFKSLVSTDDWKEILKPLSRIITTLEEENKGRKTAQSKKLRVILKELFGDTAHCFIDGSPLHKSIQSGVISLTEVNGRNHPVKWEVTTK